MLIFFGRRLFILMVCSLFISPVATAAEQGRGNLVSVQWLEQNRLRDDILLIDASPGQLYAARHIPGAVSVDVFSFGGREQSAADMEQRFRSWGVSKGRKVVIYDQGGTYMATSLFFDLYYHGFPPRIRCLSSTAASPSGRRPAARSPKSRRPRRSREIFAS